MDLGGRIRAGRGRGRGSRDFEEGMRVGYWRGCDEDSLFCYTMMCYVMSVQLASFHPPHSLSLLLGRHSFLLRSESEPPLDVGALDVLIFGRDVAAVRDRLDDVEVVRGLPVEFVYDSSEGGRQSQGES